MLLMEPEKVELFQQGAPPFSLTFFKQRLEDHHGKQEYRLWRYDICALLETSEHKYRLVIFVLEKAEQQAFVRIPCEHCFVWKEQGKYHFFKYASKEDENSERQSPIR